MLTVFSGEIIQLVIYFTILAILTAIAIYVVGSLHEKSIGFNQTAPMNREECCSNYLSKVTSEDINHFGLIPELVGRLPVISTLTPLDEAALIRVMSEPKNALVKQYKRLFQMEDADVEFTESALVAIAQKALEKKTGARGLRSIVENVMLDIMYELPDLPSGEVYRVTEDVVEGREAVLPIKEPLTKIA
jgi:ATP-dependent Clp protease ATP-binding subunit ClpX